MPNIPKIDLNFDRKRNKTKNIVNPRNLVMESYEPLSVNPTDPKVKVRFAEGSTKSVHIKELEFTNKLPSFEEAALEPYIVNAFEQIMSDNAVIKQYCSPLNYGGKNKERIKDILCKYMEEDDFDSYSDYYRKSDIRTDILIENRGAFRVITLYQVEPKKDKRQKNSKHYLIVICIDPYHLFIPSNDYGTAIYEQVKVFSKNIKDRYPNLSF